MTYSVLIEGIDRAGKSTLAKELKNRLQWDSIFLGHRPCDSQYLRFLQQYGLAPCSVIERGHISEAVYAQLFQRPTPFSAKQLTALDSVVDAGMIVIYADPDVDDALARRAQPTLQQTVSKRDIIEGKEVFAQWFENHSYQHLFTYHSSSWDELNSIVDAVEEITKR